MSKKIVILGPAYPYRGGLASYNERLAKEFKSMGWDVEIETFTLQYPKILFPGKTQLSDSESPKDLSIKRTVNSINPLNWIKVGKRLRKQQPDILLIRYWLPFLSPCFGTIARFVKKNKHTKLVCLVDNIIPHEKRIGDQSLTNYFVKPFDGFIAMSQNVYDDISQFAPKALKKLCPHPMFDNFGEIISKDVAKSDLGLDSSYSYCLFFGFIREYKGLDLLLKAFSDERFLDLKVKLIIAGEFYCDSQPYLKLIADLNLEDRVILRTDFIPNEEVASYFCASDIMVLPYKSATQSGVTQIAYHFEKPMLVTDVGGIPEIVPDGKVGYVVAVNEHEIAKALYDFYMQQKETIFVGNIKEEKKRFTWEKMAKTILEIH